MPRNVDQWSKEVRKYHSHIVPAPAPITFSRPRKKKIWTDKRTRMKRWGVELVHRFFRESWSFSAAGPACPAQQYIFLKKHRSTSKLGARSGGGGRGVLWVTGGCRLDPQALSSEHVQQAVEVHKPRQSSRLLLPQQALVASLTHCSVREAFFSFSAGSRHTKVDTRSPVTSTYTCLVENVEVPVPNAEDNGRGDQQLPTHAILGVVGRPATQHVGQQQEERS